MAEAVTVVGKPVERKGLPEKVTGQAQYTADLKLPGMLYGKVLRSPHAHARILSVDASRALQLPGVHAVLTPFNVPQGLVDPDMPILDTEVRFVGDEVAAVAAEDEDLAEEALGLIEVEYQVLPFVLDPEEALQPDAPRVHAEGNLVDGKPMVFERGSVEEGFAQADLVIEGNYRTQVHSGAALEPRAALATWEDGHLTIWKSSRGVHVDRARLARTLDIPLERVRVIGGFLGGGFGNKDEGRLGVLTALLARETGRPVRIEYTRQEEFVAGRVRPETLVYLKVGVKRDGVITAIYARSVMNSGAYTASSPRVLRRVGQAALYLYTCPNAKFEGYLAYTNCPVGGSYRGLGALQGHFALEAHMDKVAEALGVEPLEFRLRNGVKPEGQPGVRQTPPDQIVDTQPVEGGIPFSSNGLEECLRKGAQAIGWQRRRPPNSDAGPLKRGIGVAMCIYRGGPAYEESGAEVRVSGDGAVQLLAGVMEVGEGVATVLAQICAETLGVRYEQVQTLLADTKQTLKAPMTSGSSGTFSSGLAVIQAASELRAKLLELATPALETPKEHLDIREGVVFVKGEPERRITLEELAARVELGVLSASASVIPGSRDFIINAFGAHFAEVEVDTETGRIKVLKYVAAHDSGRIISPNAARNQVEGGVSQMLGFALFEELVTNPQTGATVNPNFLDHRCPTILDYPPIEVIFADVVDPFGPLGAKALGEPPSVPVAPAIANAVYNATGVRMDSLPMTPERVLMVLQRASGSR